MSTFCWTPSGLPDNRMGTMGGIPLDSYNAITRKNSRRCPAESRHKSPSFVGQATLSPTCWTPRIYSVGNALVFVICFISEQLGCALVGRSERQESKSGTSERGEGLSEEKHAAQSSPVLKTL